MHSGLTFVQWNYWYNWTIILPAELSAAAVLINYWMDGRIKSVPSAFIFDHDSDNFHFSDALWISICLIVVVVINMLGAGVYGECEFVFASIKVITITGLIVSFKPHIRKDIF